MTLTASPTTALSGRIAGIGLIGPGLDDWPAARAVLAGEAAHEPAATRIPTPDLLPPAERRRLGAVVKLAIATGLQAVRAAGADAATLATVFASSGGDGANCHAICETLAGPDRLISPTRFHNSVNNAASGYWGIAVRAMAPSTTVSAFDGSLGAGLLEAFALLADSHAPVLLVVYDHPYPAPLDVTRPLPDAFGLALLLTPAEAGEGPLLSLTGFTAAPADTLAEPALEALRNGIPAARALPLLARLARGEAGSVVLDYLDDLRLQFELDVGQSNTVRAEPVEARSQALPDNALRQAQGER
jgi:hypothetical protein